MVVSKTEGIPDTIEDSLNGFLSNVRDVKCLDASLLKALTLSQEQIKNIRKINYEKEKKDYSWNSIFNKL